MQYHRNDYCPCGSGKKYKNCHYGKEDPVVPKPVTVAKSRMNFADLDPEKADVMSSEYWEKLSARLPKKIKNKFKPFLSQIKQAASQDSRRIELEKANQTLEAYREQYEKLIENEPEFLTKTEALFSEDCFADMRFSAADAQRAFEVVGYPPAGDIDENFTKIVVKAICFLLDEAQRRTVLLKLLLHLPDYVAQKRYMDAWIIRHSVDLMDEVSEDAVSPFLITMFLFGLREWERQREQEQLAMFREVGINPEEIRKMGYADAERLIREMERNPGKKKALEMFLASHPELNDMTQARCHSAEDAAMGLLARDDAKVLCLSPWETAPWLELLEERFSKVMKRIPPPSKNQLTEKANKAFVKALFEVASKMAAAVFTPLRLEKLRAQIMEFRQNFSKDDDADAIDGINGALMMVQTREGVEDNYFLTTLCAHSLRAGAVALSGENMEDGK